MDKVAKDEVLEEIEGGSSVDEIKLEDVVPETKLRESQLYKGVVKKSVAQAFLYKFEAYYGTKLKMSTISVRLLQQNFDHDIISAQNALISPKYGFTLEEVKKLAKYKPTIFLFKEDYDNDKKGIKALKELLHENKKFGFSMPLVRTLVNRYPPILSKSQDEILSFFKTLQWYGIHKVEATEMLIECPSVFAGDIEAKLKETVFLFELYIKMSQKDTIRIFRKFPYMICISHRKMQRFLGEFKKYKMTHWQVMNVCINSGGLLGSKVSNFVGLFDTLRINYGITAQDVLQILAILPEFVLQNRNDMIRRKIELIKRESGRDDIYIRNFVKRHPDILMK